MASHPKRTAAKTGGPAPVVLSAKAARKKHAAPPGDHVGDMGRPSSKPSRKVTFQVDGLQGSSSEDESRRPQAGQAGHPPTNSHAISPKKPGSSKSTQLNHRARGTMFPNPFDTFNGPVKTIRRRRLSQTELITWSGKFARKYIEKGEKRYSRMTIGGSTRSHDSGASLNQGAKGQGVERYYVTRGTVVAGSEESDEESSSSGPDEDLEQSMFTLTKAARKFQVGTKSTQGRPQLPPPARPVDDAESDESEPSDGGAEDVTASNHQSDEPAESESDDALQPHPSEVLLQALENISLPLIRLHKMGRLPFLRRNLRAGFKSRCQLMRIGCHHQPLPHRHIPVTYSCQPTNPTRVDDSSFSTKTSITNWLCPLCNIHGPFANQRMLHVHLTWDHPSVEVQWNADPSELLLTIPQRPPSPLAHRFPHREQSDASLFSHNPSERPSSTRIKESEDPSDRTSITPSVITISTSDTKEDIKPRLSPSRATSQTLSESSRRSSTASGRLSSQEYSSLHSRSRFPQDVLGPSAVYPFLPGRVDGDVHYSCRPGGPRLYDILNTLSLEPYGVLQWLIIDREEELFELDDIRDEDKVMLALWYRWIFLNRNKFVAHYFNGTKSFVKENWQMIRQGAGLLALRTWLLALCVNNFLYPSEVVTLLRFYREMAGIR